MASDGRKIYLWIYRGLLVSTAWITIALLIKSFGHDFYIWKRLWMHKVLMKAGLNLPELVPSLSELSWMSKRSVSRLTRYYLQHVYWQWAFVFLLRRYKDWVIVRLAPFENWVREKSFAREKRILVSTAYVLFIAEMAIIPLGINWPAFWGWTMSKTNRYLVECEASVQPPPEFLIRAVDTTRTKFLPYEKGCLKGVGLFIHFSSGEVLPWNYEIVDLVFPHQFFKPKHAPGNEAKLIRLLKNGLRKGRAGKRFVLPASISYPVHTPHYPIDYTGYPSEETIEKLSFWKLQVSFDEKDQMKVANYEQTKEIVVADYEN